MAPPTALMDRDNATADSDTTAVTTVDQLTILGVKELRAKTVFKGGIAAAGFSDAFKGKSNENKPHSKDLTREYIQALPFLQSYSFRFLFGGFPP